MVLACSGIYRSDDDFEASSYNFSFFRSYFSLFLRYLRYFLVQVFRASLFFLRYSSSYPIYRPYILMADKNSYASSPFFKPRAFLIPLDTRLLFLSSYYTTICLYSGSYYLSESDWILFLCLLYDQSEEEERLSLNWISLSLMCRPSPEKFYFFILTSPAYFLKSFAFLSLINIISNMATNICHLINQKSHQYHQFYVPSFLSLRFN